jgi:hypothetical protein
LICSTVAIFEAQHRAPTDVVLSLSLSHLLGKSVGYFIYMQYAKKMVDSELNCSHWWERCSSGERLKVLNLGKQSFVIWFVQNCKFHSKKYTANSILHQLPKAKPDWNYT